VSEPKLHPWERPDNDPLHHTDEPFTKEDQAIGDTLGGVLGTLFPDYDSYGCSSVELWSRIARALRIHGLEIVNRVEGTGAATETLPALDPQYAMDAPTRPPPRGPAPSEPFGGTFFGRRRKI
jgi:hypothetical protein